VTPLARWIEGGVRGHFVVKRLKNADVVLTLSALERMRRIGDDFVGKKYDLTFEWSDDNKYCSELIRIVYDRGADAQLSPLRTLADFDLSSPEVQRLMKERYGNAIPLSEAVVSPSDLFDSALLREVTHN